jgi:hypothetical protein
MDPRSDIRGSKLSVFEAAALAKLKPAHGIEARNRLNGTFKSVCVTHAAVEHIALLLRHKKGTKQKALRKS